MIKRVNYSILYGTGFYGEDSKFKSKILDKLPSDWNIHIISRVPKKFVELPKRNHSYFYIYEDPIFNENLTLENIKNIEKWLEYPFELIINHSRVLKNRKIDTNDRIKYYTYFAKIVVASKNFFIKNNIEIFTTTYVSEPSVLIPLIVAKRLGIKIINLIPGRLKKSIMIGGYNISFEDRRYLSKISDSEKEKVFYNLKENLKNKQNPQYQEIFEKEKFAYSAGLIDLIKKLKYIKKYKDFLNKLHPVDREFQYTILELILKTLIKKIRVIHHKRILEKPNYNEKYFFFPLHYTEDAVILTQEPFVNQVNIIKQISKVLPVGYKLYVKPHPHLLASDLSFKEINEIKNTPNVRLIDYNESPYKLILNSDGVITINSTTGLEALILEKPVITFGHSVYAHNDLCYVIRDFWELKNVIFKIIKENKRENIEKDNNIKKFIAQYYASQIPVNIAPGFIYDFNEDTAKRIAEEIAYWANKS